MLDQGIKHGKEFREPYRGSKSFDRSCRNHGSCKYCERDRRINFEKMIQQDRLEAELFEDTIDPEL